MKLLLDVHHSRLAAQRLTAAGYDVVAAAGLPDLATLSDEELLRRASAAERAIVTENAKDFDRIVRSWVARGEHHAGVVFTSPRRFHRGGVGYPESLIALLTQLLGAPPETEHDWVHGLE